MQNIQKIEYINDQEIDFEILKNEIGNMKKIIIANWKMNPATVEEVKELFRGIKGAIKKIDAEL